MKTTIHSHAQPITTFTTVLVAARLAEDDTIDLRVVDPADPGATITVALPRGGAAHARFVAQIGRPPFEGPMLLYGAAQLTIVSRSTTAPSGGATALSFDALDEVPPGLAPGRESTGPRALAA
jgi:hypothetical protein